VKYLFEKLCLDNSNSKFNHRVQIAYLLRSRLGFYCYLYFKHVSSSQCCLLRDFSADIVAGFVIIAFI